MSSQKAPGASAGIKHWPSNERPRERLLREGPGHLTDAQLLAILLRVGRQDASAVQVALDLIQRLGGLQGLANRGLDEFESVGRAGELASGDGWRCLRCQREALALIRSNGPVNDRTTIDALPSIEDEEEVREPLHHHQPITLGTFHVVLLLGTNRSR